jgi:tetratricopeptide (TPR) repeat protein
MPTMLKALSARRHRGRLALAGLAIAISLAGLGKPANAGDKTATARAHYQTGTRLYDVGEYDKALLEYKSAYLAVPDPAFLFNIGQCYRNLGQSAEALKFFQRYLKKASPSDPNRGQVEARIRDIEAEAKGKVAPPSLVPSPAPGVKVEAAPAALAPAAPNPATDAVPPAAPAPLPVVASVEQAAPISAEPATSKSGRGLRIAGIACGVAGLASIGVAIYYYTRAASYSDTVSNSPNHTTADEQAGKDAQTMQWVFYGIGAGALAAGTVLYLLGWPSTDTGRTAAMVTPMVGPGLAGISARGTF